MNQVKITPRSRRLWWKPSFSRITAPTAFGIYPQQLFERLVEYEWLRSDRLNTPVSLVSVRLNAGPREASPARGRTRERAQRAETAARVVELLTSRVRKTDSVGWLERNEVGVLFPATDAAGAQAFATSLQPELDGLCCSLVVTTHPEAPAGAEEPATPGNGHEGCADGLVTTSSFEETFVRPTPRWKRLLDISGAALGLVLLSPLFGAVAAYIKLVSPGPAFFTQPRVGRGGHEFCFIKFRTMHSDNDQSLHTRHAAAFIRQNGNMQKLDEEDPRIIFGGKVLRVLCIDELPQLYNVLRGEMSLVGPRPCIPYEAAEYQRWHRHRFSILPGLTGLWQVSGKNKLSFAEMIRLDIRYEKTISPLTDVVIILRTFPTIAGLFLEAVGRRLTRLRNRDSGPQAPEAPETSPEI